MFKRYIISSKSAKRSESNITIPYLPYFVKCRKHLLIVKMIHQLFILGICIFNKYNILGRLKQNVHIVNIKAIPT